jgi:hypothetical protein
MSAHDVAVISRRRVLATTGAALATAGAPLRAQSGRPAPDTLYGHGTVWNRALAGLAGTLNLSFDLRVNLATGTGGGSASDAVHAGENFHFAITETVREPVRDEDRFILFGHVTESVNPAYVGLPIRIAAQTEGNTTAVVIRVGDQVFMGAGLVVIAIIAILIPLLLPAVQKPRTGA